MPGIIAATAGAAGLSDDDDDTPAGPSTP